MSHMATVAISRCEICNAPMLHTEEEEEQWETLQQQLPDIQNSENCASCHRVICKECAEWSVMTELWQEGKIHEDDVICVLCAPSRPRTKCS